MSDDKKEEFKQQVNELDRQLGAFSQGDMEAVRNEIVAEIRKEAFKKEILEELEMRGFMASARKTAQHPAVLLILGFALTSALGGGLTFLWQNKANAKQESRAAQQRDFEQKQAARQRLIQQKSALLDDVAKAVAETNTAAEDILDAFERSNRRAYPERLKYWQSEGSRKWRVASKLLIPRLNSTFRDKHVNACFQKLLGHRAYIGNDIANLEGLQARLGWKRMEADKEAAELLADGHAKINEMATELEKLMGLMADEIKIDEVPIIQPVPGGVWHWLFS
jgi:hypothetical protein